MRINRLFLVLILALFVAVVSTGTFARPQENSPRAKKFEVGLIGDLPYGPEKEVEARNLFDELNDERLAFVTHDGDIKNSSTACTDDVYEKEYRRFETSVNPFIYTPGDNDWTDCHRLPNPSPEEADPLNRLALLRQTFFSDGYSLGQREIPLQRQGEEYPENARWRYGGVTFATLHLIGSNNNRPTTAVPEIGNEEEWRARNEANIAWLEGTARPLCS